MAIDAMKTTTFNKTNYSEWKELSIKSLRGLPFDKLITKTIEGIDLKPLYTGESVTEEIDGQIKTIRAAKQGTGWIVAQAQYARDALTFVEDLKMSIERGNEAIVYDGTQQFKWDEKSLAYMASLLVSYPIFMTNVEKNDPLLAIFELVPIEKRLNVRGAVSLLGGNLPVGFTNVRTISADIRVFHHDGADAVTELALGIAKAAELAMGVETFKVFSEQFFARFAVDTHFFMEIAKIRAFRVLWQALGISFGETEVAHIPILAETSLRSYSKLDPYVNLLRAGNETFSAVLGGADVVTVHPHDLLTGMTPASIRLARNVQLVIKEETLLDKVIDPSGGSYFIETLTKELVEKAWNLFLEIDSQGGYEAYVGSIAFEQSLEKCRTARLADISTGAKSLIGTNAYADLSAVTLGEKNGVQVNGRLAEPFENLRTYFEIEQPRTVLLTIGELKDFKPRADFVSGFLAAGGLQSEWSPNFTSADEINEWLAQEQPDYAIVCAAPGVTESVMNLLLQGIPDGILLDAAGKPDDQVSESWLADGLNAFIYSGQDKIMKLTEVKNRLKEGVKNEKA